LGEKRGYDRFSARFRRVILATSDFNLKQTPTHMSESSKSNAPFPIHIGIKMATENDNELQAAWNNGDTPLEWNGSAIFRVDAGLGSEERNGRIVFVYDFRKGDLLGIEMTTPPPSNPSAWSQNNPVHCTELYEDMDPWEIKLYALQGMDCESYLAAWSKWIETGRTHASDLIQGAAIPPSNDNVGAPADKAFNLVFSYKVYELDEDDENIEPFDSFAELYTQTLNKWRDGVTEGRELLKYERDGGKLEDVMSTYEGMSKEEIFCEEYSKPTRWEVDQSRLKEVVGAVLKALADLRSKGIKGWADGPQ
jgi:hypothetical protein